MISSCGQFSMAFSHYATLPEKRLRQRHRQIQGPRGSIARRQIIEARHFVPPLPTRRPENGRQFFLCTNVAITGVTHQPDGGFVGPGADPAQFPESSGAPSGCERFRQRRIQRAAPKPLRRMSNGLSSASLLRMWIHALRDFRAVGLKFTLKVMEAPGARWVLAGGVRMKSIL